MSQLSYPINQPTANEGQRADAGDVDVLSMVHAEIPQISTITFGGTPADGDYVVSVTLPSGVVVDVTTTRAGGTPSANTDLAAQHVLDVDAVEALNGVLTAVDSGGGVVTYTFVEHGQAYPIATSPPGAATLVAANTQNAGDAVALPIGKFVARLTGTNRTVKVLESGDAVADVYGLIERPIGQIENTGNGGEGVDATDLEYNVGSMVPAGRRGRWMVRAEDPVTPDSTCFIRMVAGAGEVAGSVRSDADGGDALDASSIARFLSTAAAGDLVKVEVRIS